MRSVKKPVQIKKSFGIIITRYNIVSQSYEILMIKKRYTYCFVEFVLGHYSRNNDERLLYLFSNMSHEEKLMILSLDFGKIWFKVWLVDPESTYGVNNKKFSQEEFARYNNAKKHYERTFLQDSGERLRSLINNSRSVDTIWEIPKGRKQSVETNIDCAIREVTEETGISSNDYKILYDVDPRYFITVDGVVTYENYYYVAVYNSPLPIADKPFQVDKILEDEFWRARKYKSSPELKLDYKNEHQIAEVISVRWFNLEYIKVVAPDYAPMVQNVIKILKKKKIGGLTKMRGY